MKNLSKHNTYFNEKGEEVPSVTTVLKILNKPALYSWANYLGFKKMRYEDELDRSARKGKIVHQLIDGILNKNKIMYFDCYHDISKNEIYQCLDKFITWTKKYNINMIFTEQSFSSDRYAGTVDFYGEVDGLKTIVDFKTSKQVRMTMFLQLALYTQLLEERTYDVEQVGILIVNDKRTEFKLLKREELEPYILMGNTLVDLFYQYYELNNNGNWKESII